LIPSLDVHHRDAAVAIGVVADGDEASGVGGDALDGLRRPTREPGGGERHRAPHRPVGAEPGHPVDVAAEVDRPHRDDTGPADGHAGDGCSSRNTDRSFPRRLHATPSADHHTAGTWPSTPAATKPRGPAATAVMLWSPGPEPASTGTALHVAPSADVQIRASRPPVGPMAVPTTTASPSRMAAADATAPRASP
jgi:hypothetical protein